MKETLDCKDQGGLSVKVPEDQGEQAPIELVHIVGFSPSSSFKLHPVENTLLFHVGHLVVVSNLEDSHSQTIMQGHDADVTDLDISPDGKFIASAQQASTRFKGISPVLLWDYNKKEQLGVFEGLIGNCIHVAFTKDGKYVAASTADKLVVWDCDMRERVVSQRTSLPITAFTWTHQTPSRSRKNPTYNLAVAVGKTIEKWTLEYSLEMMQYMTVSTSYRATSLIRKFLCVSACEKSQILCAATQVGDVVIYDYEIGVVKYIVPPISGNGMRCCITVNDGYYCGAGDGQVTFVRHSGGDWLPGQQKVLDGGIIEMMIKGELLWVGTDHGKVYKISLDFKNCDLMMEGHTTAIHHVVLVPEGHRFLTVELNGIIALWDLTNYLRICKVKGPSPGVSLTALSSSVYAGFQNGELYKWDITENWEHRLEFSRVWHNDNAHRGAITSVTVSQANLLLTGGRDGVMRLWKTNGVHLTQFDCHSRSINRIVVDHRYDDLFHTCGSDQYICTYTFRQEKIINRHRIHNGQLTDMVQRKGGDCELITSISDGRVMVWDEDVRDPIRTIRIDGATCCLALDLSPDESVVAVAGDNVFLFSMENFELIAELQAHSESVLSVKWTADQRQLISVASDATCCIWNYYGPNANDAKSTENTNTNTKGEIKAIGSGKDRVPEIRGELKF